MFPLPITNYLQEQFVICVVKIMTGAQVCLQKSRQKKCLWVDAYAWVHIAHYNFLLVSSLLWFLVHKEWRDTLCVGFHVTINPEDLICFIVRLTTVPYCISWGVEKWHFPSLPLSRPLPLHFPFFKCFGCIPDETTSWELLLVCPVLGTLSVNSKDEWLLSILFGQESRLMVFGCQQWWLASEKKDINHQSSGSPGILAPYHPNSQTIL